MYIKNLSEFNEVSGENLPDIDLGLLKKANTQVDSYISPQLRGSAFDKAFPSVFALTSNIESNKVTLDKEYKNGLFDFTVVLIKGSEYQVVSSEIINSKTVLTISKNVGTFEAVIRIYQKTQAPFLVDTVYSKENALISKYIRQDIKEAVVLQYHWLEQQQDIYTNQARRVRLQDSNYDVEFAEGTPTSIEQLVSPEAKILLENYKTYL